MSEKHDVIELTKVAPDTETPQVENKPVGYKIRHCYLVTKTFVYMLQTVI